MIKSTILLQCLIAASVVHVVSDVRAQALPSDFTTGARYDRGRQLLGTIKADPDGSGPLKFAATRQTYSNGLLVRVEDGELATWQSEAVAPAAWTDFTIFRTRELSYDPMGRKVRDLLVGPSGAIALSDFSYDSFGRLECTAIRMNKAVFNSPSPGACSVGPEGTDGPDRITRNQYDSRGSLLSVTKGLGTASSHVAEIYTYNASGKQTSAKDANGNYSLYVYDGFNRQEYLYFPSPTAQGVHNPLDFEKYGYDENSNRTSLRKRDGSTITYQFDALNRLRAEIFPGTYAPSVYHDYDLLGRELYARLNSDSGAGLTFTYDGFGRQTQVTNTVGGTARTLKSRYDADGNRTRLTHPDDQYFQYSFDKLNRIIGIAENGGSNVVTFTYDNQTRRKSITRGTGASSTVVDYDDASRIKTITEDFSGLGYDSITSFEFNAAKQITRRTKGNGKFAYNEPVAATIGYGVNGLNQYVSVSGPGAYAPTYDANGNQTTDGGVIYNYDSLNRLISASGGRTLALQYDPRGRLFQTSSNGASTQYLYDGEALVAEYGAGGELVKRYVHSTVTDEPVLQYEGATVGFSSRRYLHADHQQTIVAVVNADGQVLTANKYDAYGVPDGGNSGRFQFTGQIIIPELGLYYYKARMYHPGLGRFLQTDPVGYQQDLDLYSYVGNDPLNRHDPSGMVGKASDDPCYYSNCTKIEFNKQVGESFEVYAEHIWLRGMPPEILANSELRNGAEGYPKLLVEVDGKQLYLDRALIYSKEKTIFQMEAKTGPNADHTPNQKFGAVKLSDGEFKVLNHPSFDPTKTLKEQGWTNERKFVLSSNVNRLLRGRTANKLRTSGHLLIDIMVIFVTSNAIH